MGLGDHILCNGIIRHYAEKYDRIYLFVKPHNMTNVSYMFRDLSKIRFISMDDAQVKLFMKINPNNEYLVVGITPEWFYNFDVKKIYETFDAGFYISAKVPFEFKWNKFYFQRDIEKEKNIFYNKLGLKDDEDFLFIHDDPKNGREFRSSYINKSIKSIRPTDWKDISLFDFIYTMEKAKEIHVMNSSFMNLIDCMQLKTGDLYLHSYARTDMGSNPNPKLKLNWTIIK
jgi:hypothetical protein